MFCETFTGQIGICKPKRIYLWSLYPWQLHLGSANNQTSPSTANAKYISKKLDISKAFDSVSWAFLLEILVHLGFGQVWRNLVLNLLATSSTLVLLNVEPRDVIRNQQGHRQGDPLSPLLFILSMDVLISLFTKAEELDLLQPLSRRNPGSASCCTLMMSLCSSGRLRKRWDWQWNFFIILVRHPVFTVTCKRVVLFLSDVNHCSWRWCHLPCPVHLLLFLALIWGYQSRTNNSGRLSYYCG